MGWGDEIMAGGQAREMALVSPLKAVAIVDKFGNPRWSAVWERLDYIVRPESKLAASGAFEKLTNHGGARPYYTASASTRERWALVPFRPPVGEFRFSVDELKYGRDHTGYIVIEPNLKPVAPPNKQWKFERYQAVVNALSREGFKFCQFQPGAEPVRELRGVDLIRTNSFRLGVAILKNSLAYIGPEGGLHHAAAALGVERPAVVLYGGYISPQNTGYRGQYSIFTGGVACGNRLPCKHCEQAMDKITVDHVVNLAREALK